MIYLFTNNQQFHSFVVLFVFQKEPGTFIQHLWVRVLIKVFSYDLKSRKLLCWETKVQRFGDVTTLKNETNNEDKSVGDDKYLVSLDPRLRAGFASEKRPPKPCTF